MKKSIAFIAIIVAVLAGVAATQPRPRLQREVLILQADQTIYHLSDGLGHYAYAQSELFVVKSHGSSGAPAYPTYTYGDVLNVSGRTNTIIWLAQTLADLRSDGWRLVGADSKTYTLEKP